MAAACAVSVRAMHTQEADAARIRAIVAAQNDAWNRGDAAGYAATFRDEGVFTIIVGTTFHTRQALQDRVGQIFATIFKGSAIEHVVRGIRFVRPDVAIVEIDTVMKRFQALPPGVSAAADGSLRTAMLQVLVKDTGDWRVAAFHNVDVKASSPQ
jgi:uncharacterized protein (TIGR02246 family)